MFTGATSILARHMAVIACGVGLSACPAWVQALELQGSQRGKAFGLFVDAQYALADEEVVSRVESDFIAGVEVGWHYRQAFRSGGSFKPQVALGLAATMLSNDEDEYGYSTDYYGLAGRCHLGFSYDFTRSVRLQVDAFGGIGGANLELDLAQWEADDGMGLMTEFGGRVMAVATVSRLELGVGVGVVQRSSTHRYLYYPDEESSTFARVDLKSDHDYGTAHIMVGYTF